MGKVKTPTKDITEVSKKRKKGSSATVQSDISSQAISNSGSVRLTDTYKDTLLYEENESLQRDPDEDLNLFCSVCDEFRNLMLDISILKSSNTQQAASEITKKRIEASLLFVTLKKLNRLEKIRTNHTRDLLQKAKLKTENYDLQLQNLLYENFHFTRESTKCLQFKSKADEIDLVSSEEFYNQAPEEISKPEITKNSEHQLTLARLEWELDQRKQQSALCLDLRAEKEKVSSEIKEKKTLLNNLVPRLKDVLKIVAPVQQALGVTTVPSPAQQKAAELLPHPLYFLFVEAEHFKDCAGKYFSVRIEGDEEDARGYKPIKLQSVTSDDSDSDTQEEVGKRHGMRKKSRADQLEERRKQLIMAHPLSVVIYIEDGQSNISLQFSYLVNLHIVTLKPQVRLPPSVSYAYSKLFFPDHILCKLFPGEPEESSPNSANSYQLKQVGLQCFDNSQLGLAYGWVQRVAGLNFTHGGGSADEVPPTKQIIRDSLPGVVSAIKKRLRSRITLADHLHSLEGRRLPCVPEVRSLFPSRLLSELTEWTPLTWPEYLALGSTAQIIFQNEVNSSDILYKGVIVRGSAQFVVGVAIKACYPYLPPLFALQASYEGKTIQASNNESIRDIEREVNVYCKELVGNKLNLLFAQVLHLLTCFDILLEASSNLDFPRDKLIIEPNKGRNRAWPFKAIVSEDGTFHFTQR